MNCHETEESEILKLQETPGNPTLTCEFPTEMSMTNCGNQSTVEQTLTVLIGLEMNLIQMMWMINTVRC